MSNDAPIVGGLDDVTVNENAANSAPQMLFPDATYSDDAADAEGVTITVSGLLSQDIVTLSGIALGNWSATGGMGSTFEITFTAGATNAEVQQVLRALAYGNVSDSPTATRELTVTVTDAAGATNGAEGWVQQTGGDNPFDGISHNTTFTHNLSATLFDVDRDGRLDLITGASDGYTRIYLQLSNGDFDSGTTGYPPQGVNPGNYANPTMADIDGDGDLDLLYAALGSPLRAYRNPNPGWGSWHEILDGSNPFAGISVGGQMWRASVLDVDGDGDLDMVAGYTDGTVHYFRNDLGVAGEQTGANNPFDGIDVGDFANQAFGDVDGDGDADLVVGNQDGTLSYFENVAGTFIARTGGDNPFASVDVGDFAAPTLGDVDNDGDIDLVIGNYAGTFAYVENRSTGHGQTVTITVNAQPEPSTAVDDAVATAENALAYYNVIDGSVADLFAGADSWSSGAPPVITEVNGVAASVGQWIDLAGGGRILLGSDGALAFDPDGDFDSLTADGDTTSRQVSFTYTLDSGSVGTVTITVTGLQSDGDKYKLGVGDNSIDYSSRVESVIINAGDGADTIIGSSGDDDLRGEAGGDTLYGGDGNDLLAGGDGSDALYGGEGDDVLKQGEIMMGGNGNDTYYADSFNPLILNESVSTGDDLVIASVNQHGALAAGVERLTLSGAVAVYGHGNELANVINGNGIGNVLYGEAGGDTIYGLGGADTLYGGDDADTLDGGAADDSLHGGGGSDTLIGGTHNDTLYGGDGIDVLHGGAGNDILDGGLGSDTMVGGAGNDIYYVDDYGADVVIEAAGEGIDTVITTEAEYMLEANVENLVSTAAVGYGTLIGNALANEIRASSNAGEVRGYGGADKLYGGSNTDNLYGDDGADTLWGGDYHDALYGGADNDILYGEAGIDRLYGGDGTDKLYGGADFDILEGGEGADYLYGEGDGDSLKGEGGNDLIEGGVGTDALWGGDGSDKLYGGDDGDDLFGDAGSDILDGGNGDDTLSGGAGADRLTGGAGKDAFKFGAADVVSSSLGGVVQKDLILDFNRAESDRIDLRDIDANINTAEDDAFTFVTRFTKQAGQAVLVYTAATDTTSLRLDVDGDGKIDHEIVINGDLRDLGTSDGFNTPGWLL